MKISSLLDSATDRRGFLGRTLAVLTAMLAGFEGTAFAAPYCCSGDGWVDSCVYEGSVCYDWDICCFQGYRIFCTSYYDDPPGCGNTTPFCKDSTSIGQQCS